MEMQDPIANAEQEISAIKESSARTIDEYGKLLDNKYASEKLEYQVKLTGEGTKARVEHEEWMELELLEGRKRYKLEACQRELEREEEGKRNVQRVKEKYERIRKTIEDEYEAKLKPPLPVSDPNKKLFELKLKNDLKTLQQALHIELKSMQITLGEEEERLRARISVELLAKTREYEVECNDKINAGVISEQEKMKRKVIDANIILTEIAQIKEEAGEINKMVSNRQQEFEELARYIAFNKEEHENILGVEMPLLLLKEKSFHREKTDPEIARLQKELQDREDIIKSLERKEKKQTAQSDVRKIELQEIKIEDLANEIKNIKSSIANFVNLKTSTKIQVPILKVCIESSI